jgi:hypothetical protein
VEEDETHLIHAARQDRLRPVFLEEAESEGQGLLSGYFVVAEGRWPWRPAEMEI